VGNTGTGKSQWAMQLAWTAARAGNPVAYIALELDVYGMHARALALALRDKNPANAPKWSEFYFGEASEEELERAEAAVEELEQIPLHLEVGTPSGWNYMRLRAIAEGMRREYPERPLLLVLDFLQLVDGAGAEEAELRIRMKNAVAEGRRLAMDPTMNTAVVFLSSTARANYGALSGTEASGSGEKRPQNRKAPMPLGKGDPGRLVGTGKESGDLEYSADTVLVLAREPWPEEGRPANGTHVWLAVAKARARAKSAKGFGWVELRFDGSCFYEPEPTSEAPKEWTA
jgi:replicative DNA helicase